MVDYKKSLKRPFTDIGNLCIGSLILFGFIVLAMVFLIPLSFVQAVAKNPVVNFLPTIVSLFVFAIPTAYFLKCGTTAAKKKFALPAWSGFGELFRTGVKLALITLAYQIPLMLVTSGLSFVILGPELSMLMHDTESFEEEEIFWQIAPKLPILIPVMILIGVIYGFIVNAALFRFLEKQKWGDAFDIGYIVRIAFSSPFALSMLSALLIGVGSFIVLGIVCVLLAITLIGIILIPPLLLVYAYAFGVIFYTILGQAYVEAKKVIA